MLLNFLVYTSEQRLTLNENLFKPKFQNVTQNQNEKKIMKIDVKI